MAASSAQPTQPQHLNGTNPAATHNGYDMYDFSEVTSDLAILRSQLFTLNVGEKPKPNNHVTATWDPHLMAIMEQATKEQDDEEWYPPSPPIYDVADKLIEINRDHQNDPASEFHLAGRLRWRPDDNLVQIKWLYKNDWESLQSAQNRYESAQNCYAEETESEEEDSSSADECGSLAVHLSRTLNLMPPTVRMDLLPTIEDVSPDTSSKADYSNSNSVALQPPPSVVLDYVDDYEDDEDFEEPSLAIEEIRSPLRDEDIVSQMETIEMSSVSSNEESSSGSGASSASGSGSGENSNHSSASAHSIGSSSSSSSSASSSCKTTKVSFKKPLHSTTSEANNNEVRPSRPRTKTTVIRTHENVQCGSTQLMSTSNQNNQPNPHHPKKSTTTSTQNPISMPKLIENSSHNSHSNSSNSNSSICKSSNSHNNSTATVSNRVVYSKAALASKTNGVQATNSGNSSSTSGVGSQSHAMNTHSSRIKIAHSGSGSNSSLVANNNNNSCSSSGEDSLSSCAGTATASSNPPSLAVRSASSPPRRNSSSTRLRSSSLQPATTKTRKVITETRPKTTLHKRAQSASAAKNKTSVYIGTNNSANSSIQGSNNSGHPGNGSVHSGREGREISTMHSGREISSALHNGRETSTTSSSQQPRFHSSSTVANSIYLQDNNNAKKQKHPGRQRSTGSAAAILHRKNSRNSLSSNSSVSSQTTEDGTSKSGFDSSGSKSGFSGFDSCGSGSSNSVNCRRYSNTTMSMINSRNNNSQPIHHRHPSIVADVISNNPGNGMSIPGDEIDTPHFLQWKKRKREEKRLRERKSFLEQQMRRH